jgi:hypothetical protein
MRVAVVGGTGLVGHVVRALRGISPEPEPVTLAVVDLLGTLGVGYLSHGVP